MTLVSSIAYLSSSWNLLAVNIEEILTNQRSTLPQLFLSAKSNKTKIPCAPLYGFTDMDLNLCGGSVSHWYQWIINFIGWYHLKLDNVLMETNPLNFLNDQYILCVSIQNLHQLCSCIYLCRYFPVQVRASKIVHTANRSNMQLFPTQRSPTRRNLRRWSYWICFVVGSNTSFGVFHSIQFMWFSCKDG